MEILSQNLKTLRESKNWSVTDVAGQIPISKAAYHHWERGRRQPSIQALKRLSRLYEVSIDSMVGNTQQSA